MDIKLMAFDLDGTFLDDDKNIPPENMEALKAAAEAGIICVPASGRIIKGMPQALRELPFIRYYISVNGAYGFDALEERVFYRGEIEPELALDICAYMDALPVIYDCYQDNWGYMSRDMLAEAEPYFEGLPGMLRLLYSLRRPVPELKETLRERGRPVQKLQMYFKAQDREERQRQLELLPALYPEIRAASSVPNNIEINSLSADKGLALLSLCQKLGIAREQTLAFGDGGNDLNLLETAGLGVAMANAQPQVIAAADKLTQSNNEAGFARFLHSVL